MLRRGGRPDDRWHRGARLRRGDGTANALAGAFGATRTLLPALVSALHAHSVVRRDDVIARYRSPWDESGTIVASQSVTWLLLDGTVVTRQVKLDDLPATLLAGTRVGTL